jgi:formate hydrogenlyase subunit 6/NADH:ubiquinone oxidoreductase subunit I
MSYYLATKTNIVDWIKGLASANQVYFPEKHGQASYRFHKAKSDSDIQFERYTPTVTPPVKQLVPAREELLTFSKNAEGKTEVSLPLDTSFRILAGVRPCDLKGIYLMDLFFRDGSPDAYYLTRRQNTAVIGYACIKPCDDRAFCAAVDSLQHSEGADVFITPLAGDELLIEVKTDLGDKLAANAGWQSCKDGASRKEQAAQSMPQPFGRSFKAKVPEIAKIVAEKYQSPVWGKHVSRCFSCGTCNLVCPTCYCFAVADDLNLDVSSGNRTRTWDGCMLPHFAIVAGAHNFRPEPASRQRHRINRKFEYLPEKFGKGAVCVGCGRCGRQCTSHIDIYDIVSDLIQEGGR